MSIEEILDKLHNDDIMYPKHELVYDLQEILYEQEMEEDYYQSLVVKELLNEG